MTSRTTIALAGLVLVAAAGCGGGNDDRSPPQSLPTAGVTTGAAGTAPEHAVLVHLALGPAGLDYEVFAGLEDRLAATIETNHAGEYDGNAIGPDEAILYAYGPDADALLDVMLPILESYVPADGSYAVKRYGPADDPSAREVRVDLG